MNQSPRPRGKVRLVWALLLVNALMFGGSNLLRASSGPQGPIYGYQCGCQNGLPYCTTARCSTGPCCATPGLPGCSNSCG